LLEAGDDVGKNVKDYKRIPFSVVPFGQTQIRKTKIHSEILKLYAGCKYNFTNIS